MSIENAAKGLIKNGHVSKGLLAMVGRAFRAHETCFGCAPLALSGDLPLEVTLSAAGARSCGR